MKFDVETVESVFPRHLLEREGTVAMIHMLADAFELWADDEESVVLREDAASLRAVAGPFEVEGRS